MKKTLFFLSFLITMQIGLAQIGVGTNAPNSTLDVMASSISNPSNNDGLLVPRIDNFPSSNPTASQDGLLVFLTGDGTPEKGFYYWDNTTTSWNYLKKSNNVFVHAGLSSDTGINQNFSNTNPNFAQYNKIVFDNEFTSTTSFDESTGTFTAPASGFYNVSAHFNSTFGAGGGTEDIVGIAIYVDGSIWIREQYRGTEFTSYYRNISTTIYLNTGQEVEIYIGFPETYNDFNNLEASKTRLIITSVD